MTFEQLKEIMVNTLNLEEKDIKPEASLKDLGVDSIDAVELIMSLEENYDIQIPDEDAAKLEKVSDIIEYINKKH
ncbi:MAG: acyl carrier protein [Eubacterium sp.]|nr:acyl carrier protein [Eubacterium sp.]